VKTIIYDITEEKKDKNIDLKVRVLTKLIHPNMKFSVIHINRVVKKGEEYDYKCIKSVLCDEEALDLLWDHVILLYPVYENGNVDFFFPENTLSTEDMYKVQEALKLSEDEIIVRRRVKPGEVRFEPMKLSDLPIKPFPEISEEAIKNFMFEMAKEEFERAKKGIEAKYGVSLS